ncbi:MAG: transcription antitermination factor NusB [Nitrospirales bacterium]|nr:transcription antitermination factor NusB [Nitrospirales bacterium]
MKTTQASEDVPTPSSPKTSPRNRHRARTVALQVLFQWDFHGQTSVGIQEFWENQQIAPEDAVFAKCLISGVQEKYVELDRLISRHAKNWTIDRMPVVDRNILRQSTYELLWIQDVPAKVTLNEALQLAKSFADDEARRFINGVLNQMLQVEARLAAKRIHLSLPDVPTTNEPLSHSSEVD